MNVYKYIYIKFYEARKSIIGENLGDATTCLLFVATVDCCFFLGFVYLFDGCMGYVLVSTDYLWLFTILVLGGALIISWLWRKHMYKQDFNYIKRKKMNQKSHTNLE